MTFFIIDPYMFELKTQTEIQDNISFFNKLIQIFSRSDTTIGTIAMYKGIVEKIINRGIRPFPINLQLISDQKLKEIVLILNNQFSNLFIPLIEKLDIDECEGDQEYSVDDQSISEDSIYVDVLYMLLLSCYDSNIDFNKFIITGTSNCGKKKGDSFTICCSCASRSFLEKYSFTDIDDIVPKDYKALEQLKQLFPNNILNCESPELDIGEHHNAIQDRSFRNYAELSAANKKLFNYLLKFGLYKIVFQRFTPKGMRPVGTIEIKQVVNNPSNDQMTVNFYSEKNYLVKTDLYFPPQIGTLLFDYLGNCLITEKRLSELIDKIN